MTTGAILTAIAAEVGHHCTPITNTTTGADPMNTTVRARLLNAVNRVYRRLLSRPGMQHLREGTTTVASVADTALYDAGTAAKIHRIWETTNDRRLLPLTLEQYRTLEPDTAERTGTPTHFVDAGYNSTREHQFYLWPTPNDAITYTLDVLLAITDLSADADVPLIPPDFHDVLVLAGLIEEYRKQDDSRAAYLEGQLRQREGELIYWLAETASGSTTELAEPPSQLGPYFPAGS
jgi:hypothetical protein